MLAFVLVLLGACQEDDAQLGRGDYKTANMESALAGSRSVEMFFYEVTDNYIRDIGKIKKQASRRIYRACGMNCLRTMGVLVEQVRGADRIDCTEDGFDLIVSIGDYDVAYTNSSREIFIDGKCYLSNVSAYDVIKNSKIVFPY